jgi:mono/diheme cytochrome c family protein
MFRGPAVKPLAVPPRNVPPGALPIAGGEPPMSRGLADGTLENPLPPTPTHLARGAWLFQTYCMPCHGMSGAGAGPVAFQMIVPPPDLTFAQPAQRSDGYLYATIRNGSIVMPAYGDAMSAEERWQLVLYLRKLQGRLEGP